MNGIGLSNSYLGYDHIGHTQLKTELVDWLEANVGRGSPGGGWIPDCSWLWCWDGNNFQQAIMVIPDLQKALLFKLTWGGK